MVGNWPICVDVVMSTINIAATTKQTQHDVAQGKSKTLKMINND